MGFGVHAGLDEEVLEEGVTADETPAFIGVLGLFGFRGEGAVFDELG